MRMEDSTSKEITKCHSVSEEEISGDETEENFSDGTNFDKNTKLHFYAARGLTESVQQELESTDHVIDAENFMGWTPLMMAVRNGQTEVVKILLEKGADVTKKNKLGMNIFSLSVANGNLELIEMVLQHMLRGGISRNQIQENLSPISLSIIFQNDHLMTWLIKEGFDLNASTSKTGLTPLMFAAAATNKSAIDTLEKNGANPQSKNHMGQNYQDIILWRSKGLHHVKKAAVREPKAAIPIIVKTLSSPSTGTTNPTSINSSAPKVPKKNPGLNIWEHIANNCQPLFQPPTTDNLNFKYVPIMHSPSPCGHFMATVPDVPQNSPANFISSPQSVYQSTAVVDNHTNSPMAFIPSPHNTVVAPQVHFPPQMQVQQVNNYSFEDNYAGHNGYYSPLFFQFFPSMQ